MSTADSIYPQQAERGSALLGWIAIALVILATACSIVFSAVSLVIQLAPSAGYSSSLPVAVALNVIAVLPACAALVVGLIAWRRRAGQLLGAAAVGASAFIIVPAVFSFAGALASVTVM